MSATQSVTNAARSGRQPIPGTVPAIFHSEDEGETWLRCGELPACERAWHVRPGRSDENGQVWAAVMPATLRSDDRGQTWQDVPGLNAHRSRPEWWPGGGGFCMHTVILPEEQPGRVYAGISVAGFFRSDDDGEPWTLAKEGTSSMAEFVATDDGGAHWNAIAEGLPRIQSVEVSLIS
jgi:hypothetical protein